MENKPDNNIDNGNDHAYYGLPFKMALPLVAVGTFILALSFAFCCYLLRVKKHKRKVRGYRKVTLNKSKENPLQETKNDTCPVCLDDFKNKEVLAVCPCSHVFHKKCLSKWLELRPLCPMCMSQISVNYNRNHRTVPGGERATSTIVIPSTISAAPAALFPSQV